jgi:predicted  nucleic acid-binding Zn-ribbon protein
LRDTLQTLVQLQSVDNKLQALEELKGDLPSQVQELKSRLSIAQTAFTEKDALLEENRKNRMLAESELESFKSKLTKYQEQLYAVTTNREYDAITLEIDTIKEQSSDTETTILEHIEAEELLTQEKADLQEEIESIKTHLQTKEVELQKKTSETEAESDKYARQREELVGQIRAPILYQYERIRKGVGGTAVAIVSNYTCSGCWATIPPQKVSEIRVMDQFILCESCGRILVYNNSEDTSLKA